MRWQEVLRAYESAPGRTLRFHRKIWSEGLIRNAHNDTDQFELLTNLSRGRMILADFRPYYASHDDLNADDWVYWPVYNKDGILE